MKGVIIRREWARGVVYWSGSQWTNRMASAHVYESALTCPRILLLEDGSTVTRRVNKYWRGDFCWASVEFADA